MGKGFDPAELMNQARKMKEEMGRKQEELRGRVVEAEAGDGLVKAFVNGAQEVVGIKISKEVVDPDDVSMLEDLVQVALNKALEKANEMSEAEMGKLTGGMAQCFRPATTSPGGRHDPRLHPLVLLSVAGNRSRLRRVREPGRGRCFGAGRGHGRQ